MNVNTEKWLIGESDVVVLDSAPGVFVLWEDETTALVVDGTLSDVDGEVGCDCCGELDVVEWVEAAPSVGLMSEEAGFDCVAVAGCDCVVVLESPAVEVAVELDEFELGVFVCACTVVVSSGEDVPTVEPVEERVDEDWDIISSLFSFNFEIELFVTLASAVLLSVANAR